MRILISGYSYADSFAHDIAMAGERMGHQVVTVDPIRANRRFGYVGTILAEYFLKALASLECWWHRPLVRAARSLQPDLILLAHCVMPPEVIRELRKVSGATIAAWYSDHLAYMRRLYLLASDLDAWFFKDPYMVDLFRAKLGLNAHYLPEACDSVFHRRAELSEEDRRRYGCDLTSACNMYYYRARLLEMFADYDLKLWGTGFPFWLNSPLRTRYMGTYVAELEKSKAFNAAKIVINTMHFAEIEGVNCRLFEAAGCGAFQIADWKPALPELFEPEREVVTFRTREELREKVDYYLARPGERQAIADRAYARAHREHTYEIRLQRMFDLLGFSFSRAGARDDRAATTETVAAVC